MRIKAIAAAVLVSLSAASQAQIVDWGTHAAQEPSGLVFEAGGFFQDLYTFTLASSAVVTSSVSEFGIGGGMFGTLKTYSLKSFGADGISGTADDFGTTWGYGGLIGATHSVTLAAGSYYYDVLGVASASGGVYSLTSSLAPTAPVPEPETYAMMLAGLGALGFLARRRRLG